MKKILRFFVYSIILFSLVLLIINNSTKEFILTNVKEELLRSDNSLLSNIKSSIINPKSIVYSGINKSVSKSSLEVFNIIDDYDYSDSKSEYVSDPSPKLNSDKPIVYIYNTHQLEEYETSNISLYGVKPNVMIASYMLRESLNNKGINTIVETNNIKEYLTNNNLNYNGSYHASEYFAINATNKYPSIKYLIDIHRDSISYDSSIFTKDNKKYAKVLFVVGYEHTKPGLSDGFASNINDILNRDYNGISRGIIYRSSSNNYSNSIDGISTLIEVGGQDNNIEEVYNTIEVLSNALYEVINGKE